MSSLKRILLVMMAVLLLALAAGCSSQTRTAKTGDNVSIDYTLTLPNGTLMDTSLEQVAKDGGIYNAERNYTPISFVIGSGDLINGFNDAVIGMKAGETKNVTLPPEQAYGYYNASLVLPYNLSNVEQSLNGTLTVGQMLVYIPDGVHYLKGYVHAIDQANNTVYIDYNNPLVGQTLDFQITLDKFNS